MWLEWADTGEWLVDGWMTACASERVRVSEVGRAYIYGWVWIHGSASCTQQYRLVSTQAGVTVKICAYTPTRKGVTAETCWLYGFGNFIDLCWK